ncbi:Sec-independent protein translocase subunit TatA [Nocardia macrotermitis]|uniref:Sec-independent protein translocase protein TatA n=1 Tax=Nocardia macrotermitis TaxID=2585198 RepID=A0A7K0D8B4_9NOCA|nr:Sec-independent protein translocase subunit TatA [Nocardia macrotermitis]MQY21829.1 Sec-independent protein translocase protein TatA [Nocardia macrotermitis]
MGALSPTHLLIVVGVLVVLFGAKRLPEAARGAGRSLRIFKSEVREMQSENSEPPHAQESGPEPERAATAIARPMPAATVSAFEAGARPEPHPAVPEPGKVLSEK